MPNGLSSGRELQYYLGNFFDGPHEDEKFWWAYNQLVQLNPRLGDINIGWYGSVDDELPPEFPGDTFSVVKYSQNELRPSIGKAQHVVAGAVSEFPFDDIKDFVEEITPRDKSLKLLAQIIEKTGVRPQWVISPRTGKKILGANINENILRRYIRETLDLAGHIEYTALVLDEPSRDKLRQYVPEGWKEINHHITLISPTEGKIDYLDRDVRMPNRAKLRMPARWLGAQECATVTAIATTDRLVVAWVDLGDLPLPMKGPAFPHVTIAVNGVSPVASNELRMNQFESVIPVTICGTIEELE
jgi:hypothetical protein